MSINKTSAYYRSLVQPDPEGDYLIKWSKEDDPAISSATESSPLTPSESDSYFYATASNVESAYWQRKVLLDTPMYQLDEPNPDFGSIYLNPIGRSSATLNRVDNHLALKWPIKGGNNNYSVEIPFEGAQHPVVVGDIDISYYYFSFDLNATTPTYLLVTRYNTDDQSIRKIKVVIIEDGIIKGSDDRNYAPVKIAYNADTRVIHFLTSIEPYPSEPDYVSRLSYTFSSSSVSGKDPIFHTTYAHRASHDFEVDIKYESQRYSDIRTTITNNDIGLTASNIFRDEAKPPSWLMNSNIVQNKT